jgi:HK97 family phage portal protein
VSITKQVASFFYKAASFLAPITTSTTNWWPRVLESFTGAWQRNIEIDRPTVTQNWAVFSCVTLIAGDIAKLPATVMAYNQTTRIYDVTRERLVLRKPNRFQTRIDFFRMWVFSLLLNGNTFILKERDEKGFIVAMYILDPLKITPLISEDGGIYYRLSADHISGLDETITVPASEIIHDRLYTLWHPLIGVSPIYACGMAAMQAAAIQQNSAIFFQNLSRPSGLLTAPGEITNETAARLKEQWQSNYGGSNYGKVAVLGDGLKYELMSVTAEDSQLIEQLKFTGEMICATFHVPPYKLGLGPMPTVNNTGALNQQYYDQALQPLVENIELRLTEGLEVPDGREVWLDESVMMRMDPSTRLKAHADAIGGSFYAPNEARREENLPPVEGGEFPLSQQQNYTLAALAYRDRKNMEGKEDVQAAAMNGAQVTSLQGLIVAAANGEIPIETARAAIAAAFPLLSDDDINGMITPLETFEPEPSEPAPVPAETNPAPEDVENSYLAMLNKELADVEYT